MDINDLLYPQPAFREELPDYFLVDLPPEAPLQPELIQEACLTLKRNRIAYLESRTAADMIDLICRVAYNWQEEEDPFRQAALQATPEETGFPRPILQDGLDHFLSTLNPDELEGLIRQDFGHPDRLDQLCATDDEQEGRRSSRVQAPELLVHLTAGNLPIPTLASIVLGLLLRSAQFVKCASGTSCIPRLFAHSIYAVEPKVASCLELAEWSGGHESLETALFRHAGCLTVTGHDKTIDSVRSRLPRTTRFVPYGHRVSFGYVAQEMLTGYLIGNTAKAAAVDVAAWNQHGCLSPHLFYVETGGALPPEHFAELLAQELQNLESTRPRGALAPAEAATIRSRREMYELRGSVSNETLLWSSADSTAWTVIYEANAQFQFSCLNRFIYVKPVEDAEEALRAAAAVHPKISTVGLAARGNRAKELAAAFANWGTPRICPVGQMQKPPLGWRHDGRPPLADLVTWTDWER